MSRIFCKVDKKEGLNPSARDRFKHSKYFDCDKFNYHYKSAVDCYNKAHGGSSKNNNLTGKVLTEAEWNSVISRLRSFVTDAYIPLLKVEVFFWEYDPRGAGYFESGFVFKYGGGHSGGDIIAYSIWDFVNKSGEMVTRITDDGYII